VILIGVVRADDRLEMPNLLDKVCVLVLEVLLLLAFFEYLGSRPRLMEKAREVFYFIGQF
jgi:hypothetical protein